jgi:hypothetical protein
MRLTVKALLKEKEMKTKLALFCLVCLAMGGCLELENMFKDIPVSLHPLYTEGDVIFDKGLLGTWGKEKPEFYITEGPNESSYLFRLADGNNVITLHTHLLKINEALFLDFAGYQENLDCLNPFMIQGHFFAKVVSIEPELSLSCVDIEKIDPNKVDREVVKERIILTASPEELQEFFRQNINNTDIFQELEVYKKFKDGEKSEADKPESVNVPDCKDPNTENSEKNKHK